MRVTNDGTLGRTVEKVSEEIEASGRRRYFDGAGQRRLAVLPMQVQRRLKGGQPIRRRRQSAIPQPLAQRGQGAACAMPKRGDAIKTTADHAHPLALNLAPSSRPSFVPPWPPEKERGE